MSRRRAHANGSLVVETRPDDGVLNGTGVLLLPPMGYEDTSSYRPLRTLAGRLADAGFVVWRIDWPGLGDASGEAWDPDLVPRCQQLVQHCLASLREAGCTRLAVLGVRAGGLFALNALQQTTFDDLLLWGTPASGKRLLREERAFHQLAAKAFANPPSDVDTRLPDGSVEAGGFVYSPQTAADLASLQLGPVPDGHLGRALLIPRDGTAVPRKLKAALGTVPIEEAEGHGLTDLLEDPYKAGLSASTTATLIGWLQRPLQADTRAATVRRLPSSTTLQLAGDIEEEVWTAAGGAGELVGIVCRPHKCKNSAWTVFFNAGGVRRSGPNRLWTQAARALARQGRPSLRLDVRDVGDSDGVEHPHTNLEAMYAEESVRDAVAAYDAVLQMGASTVDVVGLCSGAFLGMNVAARRPVRRAVLFNGLAFVWDDDARASGFTAHIRGSLLDRRRWKRLLTGRIDARALLRAVLSKGRIRAGDAVDRLRGRPPQSAVARLISAVMASGAQLQLVSSAGDPSIAYLDRQLGEGPRPPLHILTGVDHTIRPVWSHGSVLELIVGPPLPPESP